jgi:hypothetical protein
MFRHIPERFESGKGAISAPVVPILASTLIWLQLFDDPIGVVGNGIEFPLAESREAARSIGLATNREG